MEWKTAYGRYLGIASFNFESIRTEIYGGIGDKNYAKAELDVQRWLSIAEEFGYSDEIYNFNIVKAWLLQSQKRYDESEKLYLSMVDAAPTDVNLKYYLGLLYLQSDDLQKAVVNFEYVIDSAPHFAGGHGMCGWALIKLGQFKKAEPHLKTAYEMDSSSTTYIMNYAHSKLLLKDYTGARRLYMRVLEQADAQSDFNDGLLADFNIFLDNGWEIEEVGREKIHLINEWNAHYKYKATASEYFKKGQGLEDKKKFLSAGLAFDTAIMNQQMGRTVPYGVLRNYYRWAAYNYYEHKDFQSSLDRYAKAWDINVSYLHDAELEMADLEAISNLNDWMNNNVMEDMYDKMKFAAQRKIQSKQRSNNLFFISIGSNGSGYKHAIDDAQIMANVVEEQAKRIFDNSYFQVLNQDKSGSVNEAFNNVIAESKPGDCFVLYYTGYGANQSIVAGTDTISNEQILAWLSAMSASKKLLLIDAANTSLIDQYAVAQKDNKREFVAESISFLVSDGRVEMPKSPSSIFTSYLTTGIQGQAATNWKNDFQVDTSATISYVTSKSLEGFMYGNMSLGNLQFDLKSYSSGVDFPLTFINASHYTIDTLPPMIYIPNVVTSEGQRGAKTKIVTISKNVGGQALDESGIEEITVNGFPVTFTQNGKFVLDQNFTTTWTKLVISARDKKGNIAKDSFIINQSSEKLADPNELNTDQVNYALLFATSEYDEWTDLVNPLKDVSKIANLLKEYYGFQVEIMVDKTIEQMDSIIDNYTKKTYGPKDQLLVFFAGHGHYVPGRGGHIVAKNSELNGSLRSYLEFNDIRTYFNNIYSCKHMMLVFDVCFGGAAFDKNDAVNYSGSSLAQIRDSLDKFVQLKSKIPSRLFLTSGSLEYVPDESQFALKFIETLESKGSIKGNALTFDDFTNNLQTMAMLPAAKKPTTPRFGTFGDHESGGDFILVYKKPEKIETYVMKKELK